MSIFAGFLTAADATGTDGLFQRCHRMIATDVGGDDGVASIASGGFHLCFNKSSSVIEQRRGDLALVLGQPLVPACATAAEDAAALLTAAATDDASLDTLLLATRGNFSAVLWNAERGCLSLITDALATRPIYYASVGGQVVFASCLKFMTRLLQRPPHDLVGMLEYATFSYGLGERTPYQDVHAADAAQVIAVGDGLEMQARPYFDWRCAEFSAATDLAEAARTIYATLRDAVRARIARHGADFCMLSGGMDSRLVAFLLAEEGCRPTTLCFGDSRSSDTIIARMVAEHLPGRHVERSVDVKAFVNAGGPAALAAQAVADDSAGRDTATPIWSGDGGSVGLGGVFITDAMCRLCAAGDLDAVAEEYARHNRRKLAGRIVTAIDDTEQFVRDRVRKALATIDIKDGLQIPYRFLMLNDQRRHLYGHYERVAENRIELVTPFFDFELFRAILRCPALQVPYHRMYARVFEHLPEAARSVPWQTYPGHQPCPIPMPPEAELQWSRAMLAGDRVAARQQSRALLRDTIRPAWPGHVLNRWQCMLAALAVLMGRYDVTYLVTQGTRITGHFR